MTPVLSAGIDVGNSSSCVALAHGMAIEVVLNSDGQRETPTALHYGNTARAVGLKALIRYPTQPQSTVVQVKRLIGRLYSEVQEQEIGQLLYAVEDGGGQQQGHCMISLPECTQRSLGPLKLRPEQVMVSVLKYLSKTVAAHAEGNISKHVLSIPCFYGQSERNSMLAAAKVAGLTDVSLMHELTATAVCWGATKSRLLDEHPKHVAFVDVGHSATQVRFQLML